MNFLFINVNYTADSASASPLSMAYILAYLKSLGHDGVILDDVRDRPLSLHALEEWIQRTEPAVVGFTAYHYCMERIRFFSRYIKSYHKDILIMLGGPQALLMPSAGLGALDDMDIVCNKGEGEVVAAGIAEALRNNTPLSGVKGILVRENGNIIDTGFPEYIMENMDLFPSPYLSGIINLEGKDLACMLTSRGCEHICRFCVTPFVNRRKIRYHSVKRVLDEMEYIANKGVNRFWIGDPNFTASRERTMELLQGKIERGIKTPFWFQTRCDLVDEELLKKLREAGANIVGFGLESASPGILDETGKDIGLDHMRRMVEAAQSLGMEVELFTMYGLPGETIEHTRQTMSFVRSYKIPIFANSYSQQLQLYFGSIYERNPEKYGFKVLPRYRPAYLSIWHDYETQQLTVKDFKKVHNIWTLVNEELINAVRTKERSFDMLNFLLDNEEDLRDEKDFYEYGATMSSGLEEQGLLKKFISGYIKHLNPDKLSLKRLLSRLPIFKETGQGANAGSRVIFDCHSEMGGMPFAGMKAGYWDIMLGQNLFLPSFEAGFIGVREGEEKVFDFTFPPDYNQVELRGGTVRVGIKVYKVLNPVKVKSVNDLNLLNIRNHYPLSDLERLRREDIVLYYFALRDIPETDLVAMPEHFLMLVLHYAKLHKTGDIKRMARLLENDRKAFVILGDTLQSAGRFKEAVYFYEKDDSHQPDVLIKKSRALFLGGEVQRAFEILSSMPEQENLEFLEILLECLKVVQPESERIPSLDRRILDLKIKNALISKSIGSGNNHMDIRPVVHGSTVFHERQEEYVSRKVEG